MGWNLTDMPIMHERSSDMAAAVSIHGWVLVGVVASKATARSATVRRVATIGGSAVSVGPRGIMRFHSKVSRTIGAMNMTSGFGRGTRHFIKVGWLYIF